MHTVLLLVAFMSAVPGNPRHLQNDIGEPMKRCDTPTRIVYDVSVPEDIRPLLAEAADFWNTSLGVEIFHIPSYSATIPRNQIPGQINVRVDRTGALITSLRACGLTIFSYTWHGCIPATEVSLSSHCMDLAPGIVRWIWAHELGHALGLGHVDDPDSVMFPRVHWDAKLNLTADDIQTLYEIYPEWAP